MTPLTFTILFPSPTLLGVKEWVVLWGYWVELWVASWGWITALDNNQQNRPMPKVNRCRAVKQILWRSTLLASESHPIPQQKQKQTSIALFNSGTFWLPQTTPCGNYSGAVGLPALGQLSQLLAVSALLPQCSLWERYSLFPTSFSLWSLHCWHSLASFPIPS